MDTNHTHKKNMKNNVHLTPLGHNPSSKGNSVPPGLSKAGQLNPLNLVPAAQRGGNGVRLESIDHAQHQITGVQYHEGDMLKKLPSPMTGGKRKQLDPLPK